MYNSVEARTFFFCATIIPTPIDVDFFNQVRIATIEDPVGLNLKRCLGEDNKFRMEEGLCLYCGEEGHRVSDCTKKPSQCTVKTTCPDILERRRCNSHRTYPTINAKMGCLFVDIILQVSDIKYFRFSIPHNATPSQAPKRKAERLAVRQVFSQSRCPVV